MAQVRRKGRLALVVALVAVLSAAGLATGGCKKAGVVVADLPVTVQGDARVFTLFAGLNMAGYDEETGAAMDPLRVRVRDALASADPKLFEPFRDLLVQATTDALAQATIKDIGDPPGFGYGAHPYGVLSELSGALKALWAANGEALFNDTNQAQADAASALTGPATQVVRGALTYTHEKTSPFATVQVIPSLLASHGFSDRHFDSGKKAAYILVGPAGDSQTEALYHQLFYLYLGDSIFRELELGGKMSRFAPVLDKAKAIPIISGRYYSVQGFVEECLVRALVARASSPGNPETLIAQDYGAGFTLTPALYDGLGAFESSDKTLIEYVPDLLAAIDVNAVLQRMQTEPPTG